MSSRPGSSQKYRYLPCFGPELLQNIAIYRPLGGQCSQTALFTQHLPSHTGLAVSVVETGFQPKVSLFTVFRARAAPKHRYLQAFGRPVLPNSIIYATFALSYWSGCKFQPKVLLFTVFWSRAAPKHRYLQVFGRPVPRNTMLFARVMKTEFESPNVYEYGVRTSHYFQY